VYAGKMKARAAEYQQTNHHANGNKKIAPKSKHKRWQGICFA
jgi:hypothetical protein